MSALIERDNLPDFQKITIATVTTLEGIAALRPDYEHLRRVSGHRLPFALHEWHLTWCNHFLNCDPYIHDQPLFYVLRKSEGSCAAIVPFIVSRRRVGPLRLISVDLLGVDRAITEIRIPLIEPGYEQLTARAVHDNLARIRSWDWIHWTGMSSAFVEALTAARGAPPWPAPPVIDVILDLTPSWEEFRSRLTRNIRESLRHCYNSLKRDGHQFELHVIEDPAGIRVGLDRFLTLHRMRASLKHTVAHPDRFCGQVCRDFLYEVCERLAERGAVRLFALKIGSEFVAMRLGFVVGDSLYLYYSGFDPQWGRYSVMTTTIAEAIKYAIAQGLKTISLSPTNERSKHRWGPREVAYASAYEANGRIRSRLAYKAYLNVMSDKGYSSKLIRRLVASHTWD